MAVDKNRFLIWDAGFLIHLLAACAVAALLATDPTGGDPETPSTLYVLVVWFGLPALMLAAPLGLLLSLWHGPDWRFLAPNLVVVAGLGLSFLRPSSPTAEEFPGADVLLGGVYVLVAGYTSLQWFFWRRWREWAKADRG